MPETRAMTSKPSAKARELATTICTRMGAYEDQTRLSLAVLIDAALAELIKAGQSAISALEMEGLQDTPEALAKALAPWEPESGGGR